VWTGCGRIVSQETRDYWEFIVRRFICAVASVHTNISFQVCNSVIAAFAVFAVVSRTKTLDALRARTLAARIGLVRN
jgi:hypothetical protein